MWIERARGDLLAAKLLLDAQGDLLSQSAFQSQQCAEKILKAYLIHNRIRFGKTHNIAELLRLVAPINSNLAEELAPAQMLTELAMAHRYPDAEKTSVPLTPENVRKAYTLANWVFEEVMNLLK